MLPAENVEGLISTWTHSQNHTIIKGFRLTISTSCLLAGINYCEQVAPTFSKTRLHFEIPIVDI